MHYVLLLMFISNSYRIITTERFTYNDAQECQNASKELTKQLQDLGIDSYGYKIICMTESGFIH